MAEWHALEAALQARVTGERLAHTYRVLETARRLGRIHGADDGQVAVAALMHDYAKPLPPAALLAEAVRLGLTPDPVERAQPHLLHGPVAAALLAEEGLVTDREVLQAIASHTTGRAGMSLLEKVIYLADYVEPGRRFAGVEEIRAEAERDLDRALLGALNNSLVYLVRQGWLIHPASVEARNWLLQELQR
ncbi:putative HD superfamily hydrolase involved in NAD metabolism [Symbiobacterium terraclitae]|uniref:bis(5'-nucleosyl)-tetraphosphatase (symmetrical) n=1 Tax=Symbiobacterium terraclitae TaxID=557451 RepID=A0ABS4JWP1_9FIRM|nr:putative HD superfamily hydrolase involved in NAD metabolism [Symbiobacterium terraclitae]